MKILFPCCSEKSGGKWIDTVGPKTIVVNPTNSNEIAFSNAIRKTVWTYTNGAIPASHGFTAWSQAADLYQARGDHGLYRDFANWCLQNKHELYFHSAAWGLVRSDMKIPYYDITYNSQDARNLRNGLHSTQFDFDWWFSCYGEDLGKDECILAILTTNYRQALIREIRRRGISVNVCFIDIQMVTADLAAHGINFSIRNWHYKTLRRLITIPNLPAWFHCKNPTRVQ